MDDITLGADVPAPPDQVPSLTRRGFLQGAALTGGGLLAAGLAACAPATAPAWTYSPVSTPSPGGASPTPLPSPSATA
ncbi:MAG: hypothetical protein ACXWOW_00860 [Candidatus Limnocylindrales bacterium]